MKSTLNQIAQDILSIVRAKRVDDYNVTANQVKRWINLRRSTFIKNELNKKRPVDEDFIQDLECVELEMVNSAECGPECKVLRTCLQIPSPIITNLGLAITRVGPVKKTSRAFTLVDYPSITWAGNGRFANNQIFSYYLNGYIYLELKKANPLAANLKKINIRGAFENPEELKNFTDCSSNVCYDDETKYPIKDWMVDYLITSILQDRFGIVEQSITDNKNDEADQKEV